MSNTMIAPVTAMKKTIVRKPLLRCGVAECKFTTTVQDRYDEHMVEKHPAPVPEEEESAEEEESVTEESVAEESAEEEEEESAEEEEEEESEDEALEEVSIPVLDEEEVINFFMEKTVMAEAAEIKPKEKTAVEKKNTAVAMKKIAVMAVRPIAKKEPRVQQHEETSEEEESDDEDGPFPTDEDESDDELTAEEKEIIRKAEELKNRKEKKKQEMNEEARIKKEKIAQDKIAAIEERMNAYIMTCKTEIQELRREFIRTPITNKTAKYAQAPKTRSTPSVRKPMTAEALAKKKAYDKQWAEANKARKALHQRNYQIKKQQLNV